MPPPTPMAVEVDDPEGPPPPPFVRRRRKRRNLAIGAALVIIAGVPLVLGVISNTDLGTEDESAAGEGGATDDDADDPDAGDGDADGGPDGDQEGGAGGGSNGGSNGGGDAPEGSLDRPDASDFDGVDAVYAELLGDIDASEVSMIGFQDALAAAFAGGGDDDPEDLNRTIADAAGSGQGRLLDVRGRLADELEDAGAEAVRRSYVDHLDSWAEYMAAVEEDPGILGSEDRTRAFILAINVTAEDFARTLEEELPSEADATVRRFADDILDRGFRGFSESNV